MKTNLKNAKISHASTQLDMEKSKSSKPIVEKLVSERNKNTKTRLGFTHEPIPKSVSNTLHENFNTHDHSNKAKLKEFQKKRSESESSEEKSNLEIFNEFDDDIIKNGHPIKIMSYQPKKKQMYVPKTPFAVEDIKSKMKGESKQGECTSYASLTYGFNNPDFLKLKKDIQKRKVKDQFPSQKTKKRILKERIKKETESFRNQTGFSNELAMNRLWRFAISMKSKSGFSKLKYPTFLRFKIDQKKQSCCA
ncbi:hypothetical protein QVD17_08592 [Tagetes erecta]|uniref:Uncharacterized protein n=1 Tax=Tagetes erecta TaxID=13708 RepID=A0AAD8P396_TARER|nr:hypothetical protein QVD17_08592 [Tagetes erecta]